jgi:TonB family protein
VGRHLVLRLVFRRHPRSSPLRSSQIVSGALPNKVKHVEPTYPAALAQRVEGFVMVMIMVSTQGRVTDAKILQSVPLLDQAALDAARQWEYDPKGMTGPVVARVTVPLERSRKSEGPPARSAKSCTSVRPNGGVMQDERTKVSPSDQLVKFTYSELPNGEAFLTAQIVGHEVVCSVILLDGRGLL